MIRFLLYVVLLCIIGLALSCATNEGTYRYWTRYYQTRMGLPEVKVVFVEDTEERCAWATEEVWISEEGLEIASPVIHYDRWRKGCKTPWDLAKHECCHLMLWHPFTRKHRDLELDYALKEAEAEVCEGMY